MNDDNYCDFYDERDDSSENNRAYSTISNENLPEPKRIKTDVVSGTLSFYGKDENGEIDYRRDSYDVPEVLDFLPASVKIGKVAEFLETRFNLAKVESLDIAGISKSGKYVYVTLAGICVPCFSENGSSYEITFNFSVESKA